MDGYSLGGLGSLISGIKCEEGRKVVEKEFKLPKYKRIEPEPKKIKPPTEVTATNGTEPTTPGKKIKKKHLKRKLAQEAEMMKSNEDMNKVTIKAPTEEIVAKEEAIPPKKIKKNNSKQLQGNATERSEDIIKSSKEISVVNETTTSSPKKLKKKQLKRLQAKEAEIMKALGKDKAATEVSSMNGTGKLSNNQMNEAESIEVNGEISSKEVQEVLPKNHKKKLRKQLEAKESEAQESKTNVCGKKKKKDKNREELVVGNKTEMNDNHERDLDDDGGHEKPMVKKVKSDQPLNNAEKRIKGKEVRQMLAEKRALVEEHNDRTVFVGNVDVNVSKKTLMGMFGKYGKIETIRLRGAPVADVRTPKKVAIIKKEFHEKRKTFIAYIKYENRASALKAVELNGTLLNDKHIRVDMCDTEKAPEQANALFIGNIPFTTEEEKLWEAFEPCGKVLSVRLIRDKVTNIGKGFGYINFESADSVHLALNMGEVKIDNRVLRISACGNKSEKKKHKKAIRMERRTNDFGNKFKREGKKEANTDYQGFKLDKKAKKKKIDKGMLAKKRLVNKVAPRNENK